jgi:hypothetical protein
MPRNEFEAGNPAGLVDAGCETDHSLNSVLKGDGRIFRVDPLAQLLVLNSRVHAKEALAGFAWIFGEGETGD